MKVIIIGSGAGSGRVRKINDIAEIILMDTESNVTRVGRWLPYHAHHDNVANKSRPIIQVGDDKGPPLPSVNQGSEFSKGSDRIMDINVAGIGVCEALLRLAKGVKKVRKGDMVVVTASDSTFPEEVSTWCRHTGHLLHHCEMSEGMATIVIQKRGGELHGSRRRA